MLRIINKYGGEKMLLKFGDDEEDNDGSGDEDY